MAVELQIVDAAARNALVDALVDRLDLGSTNDYAELDVLDAGGIVLATYVFSDPAFGSAVLGIADADTITSPSTADTTGTAAAFNAKDKDGNIIFSGTVGTSGETLNMTSTAFTAGQAVESISSLTIAIP